MKQLHFYGNSEDQKRKPTVLEPRIVYNESFGFCTDKEAEFFFLQHKLMQEFLSKKNLIDEYNDFQQKAFTRDREFNLWKKKWNVEHSDRDKYLKKPVKN